MQSLTRRIGSITVVGALLTMLSACAEAPRNESAVEEAPIFDTPSAEGDPAAEETAPPEESWAPGAESILPSLEYECGAFSILKLTTSNFIEARDSGAIDPATLAVSEAEVKDLWQQVMVGNSAVSSQLKAAKKQASTGIDDELVELFTYIPITCMENGAPLSYMGPPGEM